MMGSMRGPGQMMSFTIDGQQFDAERTDQRVRVGTVEEWTLVNSSPMDHPMHLHVWPTQSPADFDPHDVVHGQDQQILAANAQKLRESLRSAGHGEHVVDAAAN